MPQRFLKPGLTSSERWNACSWIAQSFYVRLLTLVDDFGRFEADPRLLRSLAFPLSENLKSQEVHDLMQELSKHGLATFYTVSGKPYLQLTNWTERPRAGKSRCPAFDNNCEQMFADENISCGILPPSFLVPRSPSSPSSPPLANGDWVPDEKQKRLNALFGRRDTTRWSDKELKAFKALKDIPDDDLKVLERYYTATIPDNADFRRRDLCTLLNNFPGEVDRARNFKPATVRCF